MSKCSTGCTTGPHASWGECVRAKRLRVGQVDASAQRKWDQELALYRSARDQGIKPAGTTTAATRRALDWSDEHGRPFDSESPSLPSPSQNRSPGIVPA